MAYYYIYKITNKINGKIYIGKRTSNKKPEEDNYLGSGKIIKWAVEKYGKENFTKEILEVCTKNNLSQREIYYINLYNCRDIKIGYNIIQGGYGVGDLCHDRKTYYNPQTDQEIRIKNTQTPPHGFIPGRRPFKKETIEKMARPGKLNGMYGVHRYGKDNPFYGKKQSQKVLDRLHNTRKLINPSTMEEKIMDIRVGIPDGFMLKKEFKEQQKRQNKLMREQLKQTNLLKKEKDRQRKLLIQQEKLKQKQQKQKLKQQEKLKQQKQRKEARKERQRKIQQNKLYKQNISMLKELQNFNKLQQKYIKQIIKYKQQKQKIENKIKNQENKKPKKQTLSMSNPTDVKKLKELWGEQRKHFWKTKAIETCPYCGKQGRGVGFYRWHMENCRNHPIKGEQNKQYQRNLHENLSKQLKGKNPTTLNKICINNGIHNKFIYKEDLHKYPDYNIGMFKKK